MADDDESPQTTPTTGIDAAPPQPADGDGEGGGAGAGGRRINKRKPHRKSKTGCKQCRASRVKCDERKPSCSYCIRHSQACSFLTVDPAVGATRTGPDLTSQAPSPAARGPPVLVSGDFAEHGRVAVCSGLHMRDLELLHHYTTSTAATISTAPSNLTVWVNAMPKLAFDHPFLMHGLLATSALHLAHLHPERSQENFVMATKHQSIALPMFRSEAENVTQRNCTATFAFSALVVIYAMASPTQASGLLFTGTGGADGLPEWLHLLRGIEIITRTTQHWIAESSLAPLMARHERVLDASDELRLSGLSSLFSLPINPSMERVENTKVYREALELLRQNFKRPVSLELPQRPTPFIWIAHVSESYVKLLSERRPEALVLLAYVSVLLKRMEPCWFIDGLARRLLGTICENLGSEWRFWIEWPLQEVGFE